MFTIIGTYTNGDGWDESADTFEELCDILARLDAVPNTSEFGIEDYRIDENGQPTIRQKILYRHLKEADDIIAKSNNPESTRRALTCMFEYDPWRDPWRVE